MKHNFPRSQLLPMTLIFFVTLLMYVQVLLVFKYESSSNNETNSASFFVLDVLKLMEQLLTLQPHRKRHQTID